MEPFDQQKLFTVTRVTHSLDVFFTDFDKWFDRRDVLYWQWRKRCRRYDVVTRTGGFVSEIASFNVMGSPMLELVAQGVPEPPMIELRMSEHTKHTDG